MRLIVFKDFSATPEEFVEFWSGKYSYSQSDDLYQENIQNPFSDEAIQNLFKWKNGGPLSALKSRSVEQNYIARIAEVKGLSTGIEPKVFLQKFSKGGAIWRIFRKHCWNRKYPIYDQHVHRAMTFLESRKIEEIGDISDDEKLMLYFSRYIPFVAREFGAKADRKTDQALWAFGKFIKAWKAPDGRTDPIGVARGS